MIPKLTDEQRDAIREQGVPLELRDDETRKVYVIIEGDLFQKAAQAIDECEARRAIREGIHDLESGRVTPFAQVDDLLRKKLGLPPRTT